MKTKRIDEFLFNLVPWFIACVAIIAIFCVLAIFSIVVFGGITFWEMGAEGTAKYLGELVGIFIEGMYK